MIRRQNRKSINREKGTWIPPHFPVKCPLEGSALSWVLPIGFFAWLPITREIAEAYVLDDVKLPWYIDLLNINLENHDMTETKRRTRLLAEAFRKDGTRITENLDFGG
jgi:hypothetical protein